jgi:hypothetical protein
MLLKEASLIIQSLEALEKQAIFDTLAMMSYNPSISRVLEEGGVDKFISVANEMFRKIENIQTCDEFDSWHNQFVEKIRDAVGTTSRGKKISYGQAQKPINVFLKVYVDWAGLPNAGLSARLRPYLHVPLDSKVMKYAKNNFPQYYRKYKLKVANLSNIEKEQYCSWQRCFRELSPKKPLTIDVSWAKARFKFI